MSQYSPVWKNAKIKDIDDPVTFEAAESAIYADAMEYAKAPPIAPGTVHYIEKNVGGIRMREPTANSDPRGWMDQFSFGAQKTGVFNNRGIH